MVGLASPVLALFGEWLVLDTLPVATEIAGGCVVVGGMLVALWPRPAPVG